MSQKSMQASKVKYVTWTTDTDKTAMTAFLGEHDKGNKAENGWKPQAFQAVIDAVDAACMTKLTKDNIRSRMKTWKRNYMAVVELLSVSGFGWNGRTKMIEASDDIWADYLKSHPAAAQYRNKSIQEYDALCIIIGNDQATGAGAMSGIDAEIADQTATLEDHGLEELDGSFDWNDDTPFSSPTPTSQARASSSRATSEAPAKTPAKKKKKRQADEDITEIVSTMKILADAIQATSEKIDVKKVMDEVMKIEGFDQRMILESIEYLTGDMKKADMFLALPEDLRKAWLLMRLHI